jgi:hypothetical protein
MTRNKSLIGAALGAICLAIPASTQNSGSCTPPLSDSSLQTTLIAGGFNAKDVGNGVYLTDVILGSTRFHVNTFVSPDNTHVYLTVGLIPTNYLVPALATKMLSANYNQTPGTYLALENDIVVLMHPYPNRCQDGPTLQKEINDLVASADQLRDLWDTGTH